MQTLTYNVIQYSDGYEAVCVQYPFISWIADTREEALEGVVEFAFQCYRDKLISLK